ncbi:MAG: hypothetical protein HS116_00655 [Planctomycetes bacterium]|nr:hypothetical protein [Planctomycetota bacterium]
MVFARKIDGKFEVRLFCAEGLDAQVEWLFSVLSNIALTSKGLFDGCRIQVGWSHFVLYERSFGFVVCEPDFDRNPFLEYRESVTSTLRILSMQVDVLNRCGVEGTECLFSEKVIFDAGCIEDDEIYLERNVPNAKVHDSGWYIGPVLGNGVKPPPDKLKAAYVYEFLKLRPIVLCALFLPSKFLVVIKGAEIISVLNGSNKEVWRL